MQQALILGASGWLAGPVFIMLVKDNFSRRAMLEPCNVRVLGAIIVAVCIAADGL